MKQFVPELESLKIEAYSKSRYDAIDQRTGEYASVLRAKLIQSGVSVLDPDELLAADPEAYEKLMSEIGVMAKLQKRVKRVGAAGWLFQTENALLQPLVPLFKSAFGHIEDFNRARKALVRNAVLKGWGIARIYGRFVRKLLPGDTEVRRWWVPTRLTDVDKRRWRINQDYYSSHEAADRLQEWTIQDIFTQKWYRIDVPGAPPGLRRCDYVWCRYDDSEDDLGYAHGIGRALFHKWYMSTYAWLYAMDGAESWSKGKIVISTPNTLGGATLPGDLKGQRLAQQIRDEIATAANKQMARHTLVIDKEQDFKVHGQPTSGHEAVSWIIDAIDMQYDELILGVRRDDPNRPLWDIDPEIINDDKDMLEAAMRDLVKTFVHWNRFNFLAMGYDCDTLETTMKFKIKRSNSMDPQTLLKTMIGVSALGAPLHKDDVYGGTGLTRVEKDSPDAVFQPPPGSPVSGGSGMTAGSATGGPGGATFGGRPPTEILNVAGGYPGAEGARWSMKPPEDPRLKEKKTLGGSSSQAKKQA